MQATDFFCPNCGKLLEKYYDKGKFKARCANCNSDKNSGNTYKQTLPQSILEIFKYIYLKPGIETPKLRELTGYSEKITSRAIQTLVEKKLIEKTREKTNEPYKYYPLLPEKSKNVVNCLLKSPQTIEDIVKNTSLTENEVELLLKDLEKKGIVYGKREDSDSATLYFYADKKT